jgi:Spy/CpxP family protein refolding chaperone
MNIIPLVVSLFALITQGGDPFGPSPDDHSPKATTKIKTVQLGGQQHGPSDEEKEKSRLRLGITVDQQNRIEALFKATGQQMHDLYTKLHEKRNELRTNVYGQYTFDARQVKAAQSEILAINKQILDVQADTEVKLRKILNRQQFDRLQQMLKESFEKRRNERGARGPGGPGGRAPRSGGP